MAKSDLNEIDLYGQETIIYQPEINKIPDLYHFQTSSFSISSPTSLQELPGPRFQQELRQHREILIIVHYSYIAYHEGPVFIPVHTLRSIGKRPRARSLRQIRASLSLTVAAFLQTQSNARSVGKHELSHMDAAMADAEPTAVNATAVMLEQSPPPDCQLLKHRVDEDPRWNFGTITNIFSSQFPASVLKHYPRPLEIP